MLNQTSQFVRSLYVHVPFCAHKCAYCAFYSEAVAGTIINRYVAALIRELELIAHDVKPATIFFGGGTPSLLNLKQWQQVLGAMDRLNLLGAKEWTVECNPATVSLDKARLLRSYGVNRISMGVQSLDKELLIRLGRVHSREMVFKSFEVLRKAGFDNVNLDLMFAIPGQTMNIWRETLREITSMQSEHLSCYEVIYEEDTPLFVQLQSGNFTQDEELACAMYEELLAFASANGFQQYEIANFARPISAQPQAAQDGVCQHNVNYWRGGSFYGVGPSATSYVRGARTKNWSNTMLYCEQLEGGKRAIESREELAPLQRAGETAAFGLRMNDGWPFEEFRNVTGYDLKQEWASEMVDLVKRDWGRITPGGFQLTPHGLRFADCAAEYFLR